MTRKDIIKISLVLLLTVAAYIPSFIWMFGRWRAPGSYYNHGFLIPVLTVIMIYQRREELRAAYIRTAWWGWGVFILSAGLYLASALWQIYFTGAASLVLMLLAVTLILLGREAARIILAPLSFLFFMIPMPLVMIAHVSFRMKLIASEIASQIARAMGIDVVRQGCLLLTDSSYLIVDEPCSGLRSLIALIALGAVVAYYTPASRARRSIILLSSIPVAIVSNVLRIVTLTVIAELYGAQAIEGFIHDATGLLVFVSAFILLFLIAKLLE